MKKLLIPSTPTCSQTINARSKNEILVSSDFSQVSSCFHTAWDKLYKYEYLIQKQICHGLYHQSQVIAQNKNIALFFIYITKHFRNNSTFLYGLDRILIGHSCSKLTVETSEQGVKYVQS